MDTSYLEFQLNSLEIQLALAGATLSDYDKSQNRVRSADGRWSKLPSAMSDGEKLNVFLDKDQKIWKADTPERQEAIATIAKRLAGATDPVAKAWAKVSGGETAYRDAVLKKLAPAVALSGKDIKGIDIDERERAISDLDIELQKALPKSEANKLITELILNVSDYEHKEMMTDAKDRATESLEKTLSDLSAPIKSRTLKEQVVQLFQDTANNVINGVIDQATQRNVSDEEFYEKSRQKVQTEINRKAAQAEGREQLKRIGQNTQEFMNDIATATFAGFETTAKNIENVGDNLDKAKQAVSDRVSRLFQDNIEAYYEGRSKVGEEKYKKVKAILDKAKMATKNNT